MPWYLIFALIVGIPLGVVAAFYLCKAVVAIIGWVFSLFLGGISYGVSKIPVSVKTVIEVLFAVAIIALLISLYF